MTQHINEENFDIVEMGAKNVSEQIKILAHSLKGTNQHLRELFVNAIEAIPEGQKGEIRFDVDWPYYHEHGVYKLCVSDNGIGMDSIELQEYLNNTGSSSKKIGLNDNFGFGVKLSTIPSNENGVVYKSWVKGQDYGNEVTLASKNGKYGLKQHLTEEGYEQVFEIGHDDKPLNITDSGTSVTCLGNSLEENTYLPEGETNVFWISKYLNSKFFEIPKDIDVKAMTPTVGKVSEWPKDLSDKKSTLGKYKYSNNKIVGAKEILSKVSSDKGSFDLNSGLGTIYWWILKENYKGNDPFIKDQYTSKSRGLSVRRNFLNVSHYATIIDNEIFNVVNTPMNVVRKMNSLGITHGNHRVVIYFKPNLSKIDVYQDASRQLLRAKRFDKELNSVVGDINPFDLIDNDIYNQFPIRFRQFIEKEAKKVDSYDTNLSAYHKFKKKFPELNENKIILQNGIAIEKDYCRDVSNTKGPVKKDNDKQAKYQKDYANRNKKSNKQKHVKTRHKGKEVEPRIEKLDKKSFVERTGTSESFIAYYNRRSHLIIINGDCPLYSYLFNKTLSKWPHVNSPGKAALNKIIASSIEALIASIVMSGLKMEGSSPEFSAKVINDFLDPHNITLTVWNHYIYMDDLEKSIVSRFGKSK